MHLYCKKKKEDIGMTRYDYLNGNKKALSRDGRKADIVCIGGFSGKVLLSLGKKRFLRGDALKDYHKMQGKKGVKGCP